MSGKSVALFIVFLAGWMLVSLTIQSIIRDKIEDNIKNAPPAPPSFLTRGWRAASAWTQEAYTCSLEALALSTETFRYARMQLNAKMGKCSCSSDDQSEG